MNEIIQQAKEVNWEQSEEIITFYERNLLFFNNYKVLTNEEAIIETLNFKMHFVDALVGKKRYTKAKGILPEIDYLLQRIMNNQEVYQSKTEQYEFLNGIIEGYLNNYEISRDIFSRLLKIDPDNDLYQRWYSQMRINYIHNQVKYLGYIGAVIVVGDLIADVGFEYDFDSTIVLIGIFLMLGSWGFPNIFRFLENIWKKSN